MAQHEGGGKNLGNGIGEILACDVRSGAAGRLVKTESFFASRFAETGTGQHTEGSGQGGGLVAEDVAEGVFAEHHIELRGVEQQLHGGVVHEHVIQLHVRIVFADFNNYLAPKHAVLQHVGFVDAHQSFAAQLGAAKANVGDALDFAGGVDHRVDGALLAVLERLGGLRLAEIHAAGEFAHDE